ncbi:MAG: hypothetical protein ACR2PI_01340 [Hyphomicrobiaceae bacterium]
MLPALEPRVNAAWATGCGSRHYGSAQGVVGPRFADQLDRVEADRDNQIGGSSSRLLDGAVADDARKSPFLPWD